MSAVAAPPPPPPPGGGSGKGPGHNSPGSSKGSRSTDPRNRGDGSSAKNAYWTQSLWNNPDQAQYVVNHRGLQPPYQWVRCTQGEARYDFDAGFPVYRVQGDRARVITSMANRKSMERARGDPFHDQFRGIEQEERDRVARHESVGNEEEIMEDLDEEYEGQDPSPFDTAMSSSRMGKPNHIRLLNSTEVNLIGPGSFSGNGSRDQTPVLGAPFTPHRRGTNTVVSSPLSPTGHSRSGASPQGQGFGSSPRGQELGSSTHNPSFGSSPRGPAFGSSPRGRGQTPSPHSGVPASSPRGSGSSSSPRDRRSGGSGS
ncbi:hypothetical protein HBH82_123650 [Parastagonospora nodorum]|nr:hypothetical protein HBH82_123650 [Parastagonospora nodorum]KAH4710104.1 hypothetical protein HBH67_043900 [Parastagonospora nodorum]KAH4734833.1 hypothetical protein HBH78_000600 [Parastagonospora nodorum]KAH4783445.1 hypothetical protein HBH62_098070 [Parastagonospora nodorum]KAH4808451.1 hypothetical protein HBH63_061210 [Parastagonospora nodorum]